MNTHLHHAVLAARVHGILAVVALLLGGPVLGHTMMPANLQ